MAIHSSSVMLRKPPVPRLDRADVVDQDVEAAVEDLAGGGDELARALGRGEVDGDAVHLGRQLVDVAGGRDDRGALFEQRLHDRQPDALARAR